MSFAPVGTVGATFGSLQSSGPAMSCATPGVGGTGAVTCTMTTMPVDASATFTVTVHVDAAAPRGDFLTYRAQVSPSSFPLSDPLDENDTATQSTWGRLGAVAPVRSHRGKGVRARMAACGRPASEW
jgi:hypothetical protein